MKKLLQRRTVRWLIGLLLVAGLFGIFLQYSTTRTLELAEALQFRRMVVAEEGTYRFFYTTNRKETEAESRAERFGNEREAGLKYGVFDTTIEPSLGIGMLINPSDWFQNEEIQLRRVAEIDHQDFLEQLRAQVDASPARSLLININGFRERFNSALRKTAFLAHVLDMNTPLLVFDWPAIRVRPFGVTAGHKGSPKRPAPSLPSSFASSPARSDWISSGSSPTAWARRWW